jgi:hypothetical protein
VQSRLRQWNGSSCSALESAHLEKKSKKVGLDLGKKAGAQAADIPGAHFRLIAARPGVQGGSMRLVDDIYVAKGSADPCVSAHPSCFKPALRLCAAGLVLAFLCMFTMFTNLVLQRVAQLTSFLLWSLMPMVHTWLLGTRGAGLCCLRRCLRSR